MNYVLSFRGEEWNTGGPVVTGRVRALQTDGLEIEGSRARDLLALETSAVFLLHGYNVSRDEGADLLLRFAAMLQANQNAALVSTLWPGDHWVGFASYPFEGRDADDTASEFAKFIGDTLRPDARISFVTHSLGARVALGTMKQLIGTGFSVEQVCLMAPAVDDFALADAADYRDAVEKATRVGVLHSTADNVLKWAYPAGDLLQSFVFFWRDTSGLALGYHGPRSAERIPGDVPGNVVHHAIGHRGVGHADYLPGNPPNAEQVSAASYVDDLIAGRTEPNYP